MSLLLDTRICPDCRAPLTPDAVCTRCGLRLNGPLAVRLLETMRTAAALVEQLRADQLGVDRVRREGPPVAVAPPASQLPPAPPLPARAPSRRELPGSSVPAVLFGLGALCLLVAAIVFVVVAWGSLGLGARTSIMLGVTVAFGAVAVRLTRRGLRGAAETFWAVVAAMVTIDLTAGWSAGLLGYDTLAPRHATAVLGAVLFALGLCVATAVGAMPLRSLVVPAITATTGAVLITGSEAWAASAPALATAVSVPVLAALAWLTHSMRLRGIGFGLTGLTVVSWGVLFSLGLARVGSEPGAWWGELDCWPLIVAALYAAALTVMPRHHDIAGRTGAAVAELTLAIVLVGPASAPGLDADAAFLLLTAAAAALALVVGVGPRLWAGPAAGYTAMGLVVSAGYLLARPIETLHSLPFDAPDRGARLGLRLPAPDTALSAWTAIVVGAVVAGSSLALLRRLPAGSRGIADRTWTVLAPVALGLGIATTVIESEPTLLIAVATWTGLIVLAGVLALARPGAWAVPVLALAGYLIAEDLILVTPSHPLAALAGIVLAAGIALAYRSIAAGPERIVLASAGCLLAGFAAVHAPYPLGGHENEAALTLVLLACALGLAARILTRSAADRIAVELTALCLGLAATALPGEPVLVSLILTLAGSAAALSSVLHRDRDEVAWLGTVLLGIAALIRVGEHLALPEITTAPAAALLLVAGTHRLLTDPAASSVRALGSGLTLAFLPTLLLTLDEPVSVRAFVLGVLAVAVLAAGILRHWSAPFLAGTVVLGLLALRHLGPVAEAVPRWISFGLVGVALLAVAVTWEARRADLARAGRYLTALR